MAGDFLRMMKNQTAVDASAGKTFTAAEATDICTANSHGYATGDGPFYLTTSSALPAGLAIDTLYWLIRLGASTFSFAKTKQDANWGNVIDITDAGTGVHTMHWDHWYDVGRYGRKSVQVAGLASGDVLEIRGANTPTKPATDEYGTKIISDVTEDGFHDIPEGVAWMRAYLSVGSGSAVANVYMWGQKHIYG